MVFQGGIKKGLGLLCLLVICASGVTYAQADFQDGYVITNVNDTLYGQIDSRGDITMGQHCRFRDQMSGEVIKYRPDEIRGFRFIEGKFYVSKVLEGQYVFMEYLIQGQLSAYYRRDHLGDHYYIENSEGILKELEYQEKIVTEDDTQYFQRSTKHIGLLLAYMKDAPEMRKRLNRMGEPSHENLIPIMRDYHNVVCDGEACIIYEKKQPFIKINPEIVTGVAFYKEAKHSDDMGVVPFGTGSGRISGVILQIWMPRLNERMFLKTGYIHAQLPEEYGDDTYYKVPLKFQYRFPGKTINPHIAYGVLLNRHFQHSVGIDLGLEVKLYKQLYAVADYSLECMGAKFFAFVPGSVFSHNVYGGLSYHF